MKRDIGLALSGGGFRAAAFHLGCLRALQDRGLLNRVRVVSGISGGSLLAALWAYGPSDFGEFDDRTTQLLRRGLHATLLYRALHPRAATRNLTAATRTLAGRLTRSGIPAATRRFNRTDALAAALADLAFGDATMAHTSHPGLDTILTATDLVTGNAVRFGSAQSSCSPLGTITEPISVATAVAASAAFPALLPAIERTYTFERRGQQTRHTVLLTDGGVYDNLGISPLEPGRSMTFTPHVYDDIRYIISCDAGRGALAHPGPHFWPGRMARSFEITHRKAQDASRTRLHEWAAAGRIDGFALAYLGMRDDRLPVPVHDLIPQEQVASYGTNFAAMSENDLWALSTRGEQLIRVLLPIYCARLN
ncbi:patatin-like phospholipase family protein [Kitasatospora indigofera]|uniref:patatin-like phospholipase family protein n=1 Tax=Kitasatospora indigofera TaxID=67307 RepID=UPI0033A81800